MTERKKRIELLKRHKQFVGPVLDALRWLIDEYEAIERDCYPLTRALRMRNKLRDQAVVIAARCVGGEDCLISDLRKIAAHFADAPEYVCPHCGSEAKRFMFVSEKPYFHCQNNVCYCRSPYASNAEQAYELWHNPKHAKGSK